MPRESDTSLRQALGMALLLALASAVALGLARFAYALLLPPMRDALGWNWTTAGGMNTANAVGYLIGALLAPTLLRRSHAVALVVLGCAGTGLFMLASGFTHSTPLLLGLRVAAGITSALIFVGGGMLAARLAGQHPARSGLLLGLYYGGPGLGIVASALILPGMVAKGDWPAGWLALGSLSVLIGLLLWRPLSCLAKPAASAPQPQQTSIGRLLGWGLGGYLMFGLGYIGYMTFVLALLRNMGHGPELIHAFFLVLGLGVMGSSWLWARLLQQHRDGRPMMVLNGLLALATIMPVLSSQPLILMLSGLMFGAVFLSVVASTTALVRHNLPADRWPQGITAFTVIFAAGQIVGPTFTGWLSDVTGNLQNGLAASALLLALGSVLASRQRALG
jgi:predicted MFS family arabinose efflux permease